MVEPLNPQDFFHSFEVFGHVRPMAGTYHIVDLTLEKTENILENAQKHHIQYFHDAAWLHVMGQNLIFCMSQPSLPLFGFSGSNSIALLYKHLAEEDDHAQRLFSITSHAASFLSTHLSVPVKFQGKLLEFPSVKVLCAFFLWKQVVHRRIMIHSMCLAHLMAQGKSPVEAQEAYLAAPDEKARLSMCAQYLELDRVPSWQLNGLIGFWASQEDRLHLTMHQDLPSGPDFLAFLMDAFGRSGE
ncbi:MAG: hypothetical protein CVU53_03710 [Deltaproteobacteria bacterium HGW-Deltaproteobacteria-11]|nr:MAG: hypothetical protein CVU53_03710 [Deltaproteobacteria bacterium HGW-Deltaproteobacteria-11]